MCSSDVNATNDGGSLRDPVLCILISHALLTCCKILTMHLMGSIVMVLLLENVKIFVTCVFCVKITELAYSANVSNVNAYPRNL